MLSLEIQISLKGLKHDLVKKNLQEILRDIDYLDDLSPELLSELKMHRQGL